MQLRTLRLWTFGTAGFGLVMVVITSLGISTVTEAESRMLSSPIVQELPTPTLQDQLEALASHGLELAREDEVRKEDNMARLLERLGVEDRDALTFLMADKAHNQILRANVGKTALVHTDLNGSLLRLQLMDGLDAWVMERTGQGRFSTRTGKLGAEVQTEHRSVLVGESFFGAMDQAGVPNAITEDVVNLFESDLDFRRQVKPGDKVRVIYENRKVAGREIGDYRLVAVRFEASGTPYEALFFNPQGTARGNYYDAEGKSVKRGFLAAPLRFTRISSSFSRYRLHPLFGDPRAHRGVDYAAPIGTPVRSVADGVITNRGWNGGYGNGVEIQHNARYSTYYAHLSGFAPGMTAGREVRMGEVIGYVGATGWATGPHLHYEFRVQGRSIDPIRIAQENPQVPSLSGEALDRFLVVAEDLRKRLTLLDSVNTAESQQPPALPIASPARSSSATAPPTTLAAQR